MSLSEAVKRMTFNYHYTEEPLLKEVYNEQICTLPTNIRYEVSHLLLLYKPDISMSPEDVIAFHVPARQPLFYYALHVEPYLSIFLKNAASIKVSIFIDQLISFKFSYPVNFRLFLSGKKIIAN